MAIFDLFFELLRVSLDENLRLSKNPDDKEWEQLYQMAEKQSLIGITFVGVQKLHNHKQIPPELLLMRWYGMANIIRNRNKQVNQQCVVLSNKYKDAGFQSCILKGQGVASLYDDLSELRTPGDIDIWIDGDRDKALDYARKQGVEVSYIDSVHAHATFFSDTQVEVHSRPSWMYNKKNDQAFINYWTLCKDEQFNHYDSTLGFCYPTVAFNLVYSLLHINRHIFEEGIGLRQLVDYYFILKSSTKEERNDTIYTLSQMNLLKFASGILYILNKYVGLSKEYLYIQPNEKEGEYLLKDILIGGNFGKYDDRNVSTSLDERWKRGWYTVIHNFGNIMHYPSEVLSIPGWKIRHYLWRKKRGYI